MPWVFVSHPAVRKDLRNLSAEACNLILQEVLPTLTETPFLGQPLHGPLKGLWRYRVGEYRLAYALDQKRHELTLLLVGPRGGFYEQLRRRIQR